MMYGFTDRTYKDASVNTDIITRKDATVNTDEASYDDAIVNTEPIIRKEASTNTLQPALVSGESMDSLCNFAISCSTQTTLSFSHIEYDKKIF